MSVVGPSKLHPGENNIRNNLYVCPAKANDMSLALFNSCVFLLRT